LADDFDIFDEGRILQIALRELDLAIDPKLYDELDQNDVWEIYDAKRIPIFRSFNFFRLSDYGIDEIVSHETSELYERAPEMETKFLSCMSRALKGELILDATKEIESHLVREKFSFEKKTFVVTFKTFAPLFRASHENPSPIAVIIVSNVQLVGGEIGPESYDENRLLTDIFRMIGFGDD